MKKVRNLYIWTIISLFGGAVFAQETPHSKALTSLENRGEVILQITHPGTDILRQISEFLSLDHVDSIYVRAYANARQFEDFLKTELDYSVLDHPGKQWPARRKSYLPVSSWEVYPTYQQYDSLMVKFAENHPGICKLDTIGTSEEGRLLLAVKISDNVALDEPEPEFFYSSTMHGDETVGYVLMLRLIDYLLNNYGLDAKVSRLVDSAEVWINPLANPDGTYRGGEHTVSGAVRFNANAVDLNRNFPDPEDGPHPDGNAYQAETLAMMKFIETRNFSMSANFHSGAEVVNYPWDTWVARHADDDWFQFISHEYADTVHAHSANYMTGYNNGITNGFDWYSISGGRQDYITYFKQGRETTLEIHDLKITPESQLNQLWEYNYRSFLNYASQVLFGVRGFVTDAVLGTPVPAMITVETHDSDSSVIYADTLNGFYVRLLKAGQYSLTFSAEGYFSTTVAGVSLSDHKATRLNVSLIPKSSSVPSNTLNSNRYRVFPNPFHETLMIRLDLEQWSKISFTVLDITGRILYSSKPVTFPSGVHEEELNLSSLAPGTYILLIHSNGHATPFRILQQ